VTTEPLNSPPDSPPESADSPVPAGAAPVAPVSRKRSWLAWVAALALIVGVFAVFFSHYQLAAVKRESARRLADLQQAVSAATETATRADAEARAARQQAALLEARLAEELGQREALEQLYSDLSRGRDEAVLVEVERLITLAAQELQISSNVSTALAALQTADVRLARADSARFLPLRRVLARDIEKLKAAPTVDMTGMALKLDQLASAVETWPLLADAKPAPSTPPAKAASAAAPPPPARWWQRRWDYLQRELDDFRDLIRIRQVEGPDSVLINTQQQTLVRQLLRLRLLNARQALLARNDRLYRADLAEAQSLMNRYVDTRQAPTASAAALIKQLASTPLSVDLPQISDSLAAVRAVRTVPTR
jgi:uncharacterized protein HemX